MTTFWLKGVPGGKEFKYTEMKGHTHNDAPVYHNPIDGYNPNGNYMYKMSDGRWIFTPFYTPHDGWAPGPKSLDLPDFNDTKEGDKQAGALVWSVVSKSPAERPTDVTVWMYPVGGGLAAAQWSVVAEIRTEACT